MQSHREQKGSVSNFKSRLKQAGQIKLDRFYQKDDPEYS